MTLGRGDENEFVVSPMCGNAWLICEICEDGWCGWCGGGAWLICEDIWRGFGEVQGNPRKL